MHEFCELIGAECERAEGEKIEMLHNFLSATYEVYRDWVPYVVKKSNPLEFSATPMKFRITFDCCEIEGDRLSITVKKGEEKREFIGRIWQVFWRSDGSLVMLVFLKG